MATTTPNIGLHKYDPATDGNQTFDITKALNDNWDRIDGGVPTKTTGPITFYVNSSTGSDTNDGKSASTPLKTIQKAVNSVPQIVNHAVTIIVAPGTYNEDVMFSGFVGKGTISLHGDTAVSTNYTINSFVANYCTCGVYVRGFNANPGGAAFVANFCLGITFDFCRVSTSSTVSHGAFFHSSIGAVSNSSFSNRLAAIAGARASKVFSSTNTGSGNQYGLLAAENTSIGIYATQPGGVTSTAVSGGGVIR